MRRIFVDTEFLNMGAGHPIDLISIGMVDDKGGEFYGINVDMPLAQMMRNTWIRDNLWATLPLIPYAEAARTGVIDFDHEHAEIQHVMKPETLRQEVYDFIVTPDEPDFELWGSFSGFDYVVLSQLFGTFDDTPTGMPMFIHDIQQVLYSVEKYLPKEHGPRPRQAEGKHHALADARHVKTVFDWLFQNGPVGAHQH